MSTLEDWSHTGEKIVPPEYIYPYSCSLILTPFDWLDKELMLIQSNREVLSLENNKNKVATIKELKEIFKACKLAVP